MVMAQIATAVSRPGHGSIVELVSDGDRNCIASKE